MSEPLKRLHYKVVDLDSSGYTGLIEVYENSIIVSKEEIVNGGGGQAYSVELAWEELIALLSVHDKLEKC